MQGQINLNALNTEVFTGTVEGFANYSGYADLSNMAAGDKIAIAQYLDVAGVADRKLLNYAELSFEDLQTANEQGGFIMPFSLEADQTGVIGFSLLEGSAPLLIEWRLTDLQTGL